MDERRARLQQLLRFLDADPSNLNLLHDAIDLSLSVSSPNETHALIERACDLAPSHPRTLFQQATLNISQHEFALAEQQLATLQNSGLQHAGILYNLALCHVMQGNFAEARPLLESLHNSPERFVDGDILFLRTLHHLGDTDKALPIAEETLSAQPDNADALGILSLLLMDTNQGAQAIPLAEKALQAKPDNLEALATLGTHALEIFEVEAAKQHFEHAIKVQPNDGRSWMGCGLAAALEKNLDLSEACLEKALSFMPGHLGTWNALAWVRLMKGDISGAEQAINTALDKDRTFSENHGMLAIIHILQGQRELAPDSIKRALRLDNRCFSAHFAQTLLLDPETDKIKIQRRMQHIISTPIVDGGSTIEQSLQSYMKKSGKQ